ncbi:MAG: hypothetical protein M3Y59_00380 [Myxococcota bacterium]|nr:hypothetical protein [Myxococcota bacterium]
MRAEQVFQVNRGLYEVSPPVNEGLRRCTAALLTAGEGAVLSHRSAAKLHRLWGIDGFPVELTVPRRLASSPLPLTVHRGTVPPSELERVHHLPVTSMVRTVTDLAPWLDIAGLAGLVESARRRQREFIPRLGARVAQVRPREAQQRLEWVLADTGRRPRPMDSMFEIQFWHRWLTTGLPAPVPQWEVQDPAGRRFYVDFAWPEAKVALETQGYGTRQTSDSFDKDSRRTGRLIALGWIVIPISYAFFRRDFLGVLTVVREALRQRRYPGPASFASTKLKG